jgi:hypothetical protein
VFCFGKGAILTRRVLFIAMEVDRFAWDSNSEPRGQIKLHLVAARGNLLQYSRLFAVSAAHRTLIHWLATSGRDPNQSRRRSGVSLQEGFMENLIIVKKKTKLLPKFKENDRANLIIESVFINFKRTVHLHFK